MDIRVDIVAGFLGAGKTTLLRHLLQSADPALRIAVCENEFGEVGLDGLQLREDRFDLLELNAGCVCCTLGPALAMGLKTLCDRFHPDRILLEPTGLAGLADLRRLLDEPGMRRFVQPGAAVAVISGSSFARDMPRFERYYMDMISSASCICLNRVGELTPEQRGELAAMIVEHNVDATVLEEPSGQAVWAAMEGAVLPPAGVPQSRNWLSTFREVAVPSDWPGSRERMLSFFDAELPYGDILRAKGFVQDAQSVWWQADYVAGTLRFERSYGPAIPWLQIIGRNLAVNKIKRYFNPDA